MMNLEVRLCGSIFWDSIFLISVEDQVHVQAEVQVQVEEEMEYVPPLFTEPGWNMHTAAEIGIDSFEAERAPDGRYRTTPLKGLWAHSKGGFYHDGRFATMRDVVDHYNAFFKLGLSDREMQDLVEYLKSL
jgi:cytochrome c peroxidase